MAKPQTSQKVWVKLEMYSRDMTPRLDAETWRLDVTPRRDAETWRRDVMPRRDAETWLWLIKREKQCGLGAEFVHTIFCIGGNYSCDVNVAK